MKVYQDACRKKNERNSAIAEHAWNKYVYPIERHEAQVTPTN